METDEVRGWLGGTSTRSALIAYALVQSAVSGGAAQYEHSGAVPDPASLNVDDRRSGPAANHAPLPTRKLGAI